MEAADGEEAFDRLQKGGIGFVVTDWNMPKMDGLAFLKQVRADERLKDTPVLMLTAEQEKTKVIEAIRAGVDNYIVKPFTADVGRRCIMFPCLWIMQR